jgi:SEC-C motif
MSSSQNAAARTLPVSRIPAPPESSTRLRIRPAHGHARHFLSRLRRVKRAQIELALSLYRDPTLVKAVFESANLPESTQRVAISLKDPKEGPFIIVARDGYFVTCLGKRMSVGALPVIPREQLDAVSARIGTPLERLRAEQALERARQCWAQRPAIVRKKAAGRNEPCPCDSGKKFKRCCG